MKYTVDNGQVTFYSGNAGVGRDGGGSGHEDGFRVQLYWPQIKIKDFRGTEFGRNHWEFYFKADTVIRIVFQDQYWGLGFQFLGFGIGADHQKQNKL